MNTTLAPNPKHRFLFILVTVLSVAIPAIVFVLTKVKLEVIASPQVYVLPMINAMLNGACAVLLLLALYFAKKGNYTAHARTIYTAMGVSLLFLVGYILYHISTEPTPFGGEGAAKTVYYVLLATHIILAGLQTPFVLFAFVYGVTNQPEKHRRLVKLAFPIWLYVSVTGVVCYWMISPYYPV